MIGEQKTEQEFQLGSIGEEQLDIFAPLLLPTVVEAMKRGEPVTAIGIVKEGIACGALAGYVESGCFHVASLYVAPDYRRAGGAGQMLSQMEKILQNMDGIWAIDISFTNLDPDNESMIPFLENYGFALADDAGYNIYMFTLEQLAGDEIFEKEISKSLKIVPFSKVSEDLLHLTQKHAFAKDAPVPEGTLTGQEIEKELSHVVKKDGEVVAFIAFDRSCCGVLTLSSLWSEESDPIMLFSLLKTVIKRAKELYPLKTPIALQVINDQSLRLIEAIVPDAKRVSYTYEKALVQNA